MRNGLLLSVVSMLALFTMGANGCGHRADQEKKDHKVVQAQQAQYATRQPIPTFDWSLEREQVIQLYKMRNIDVATHSVWRGDTSVIEGDCPSMGFGIPYDTSLTNPWKPESLDVSGHPDPAVAVGQPEPNGVYASTNTSATWVMCVLKSGELNPVYVESKVTVYPGTVAVDYETNRVRFGDSMYGIKVKQ